MVEPVRNFGATLAAARAGSTAALGAALQSCQQYLALIARQEFDAELQAKGGASDLVQETFLEAQRDIAGFHGTNEAELLAWLRQILVNNVANFSRKFRVAKRAVGREMALQADDSAQPGAAWLRDPQRTPSSEAVEREEAAALQRTLARLPEDYRQAIVLRYLEDRSFEEIGTKLNRSADAARKLWLRAMQRLREESEGGP